MTNCQKPVLQQRVILNFQFFKGKHWNDGMVLAILKISILKTPNRLSFMLSSRSAHLIHLFAGLLMAVYHW